MSTPPLQVIKGSHDIGSAVAHLLRRAGLRPVVLDRPRPLITRRRMCFGSVLHSSVLHSSVLRSPAPDGSAPEETEALLEGLRGVLCTDASQVLNCLEEPDGVPVLAWEGDRLPSLPGLEVVVDARMRKKEIPQPQRSEAALVLGIGPGFAAGFKPGAMALPTEA